MRTLEQRLAAWAVAMRRGALGWLAAAAAAAMGGVAVPPVAAQPAASPAEATDPGFRIVVNNGRIVSWQMRY